MDETENSERSGVVRNQNVLHILPHSETDLAPILAPLVERVAPETPETQLLVLVPDSDVALAAARVPGGAVGILPITSTLRGARMLRARPALALAVTPAAALELVRSSVLKLDRIRTLVLAYADAILESGGGAALESVLSELPKDAARVIIAGQLTPGVEELVERYARRPRRVGDVPPSADAPSVPLRYVSTSATGRIAALRRVIDELDPERAAVYVRAAESAAAVRALLDTLGYTGDDAQVVMTDGAPVPNATALLLYDLPSSRDALRALGATRATVVALAQPRQLGTVRSLAGTAPTPLVLGGPSSRARSSEEAMRSELRGALAGGAPARELLALEPLLDEYDGVELAAAALRLLDDERKRNKELAQRASEPVPRGAPAGAPGVAGPTVRLFINAGARDNIAARDLVGAIANEGGVSSEKIGKIELRDTHAIVEIAADVAESIVERLTGKEIRGRRIVVRVDVDPRPPREDRGSRPPRGRESSGPPRGRPPRRDEQRSRPGDDRPARPFKPRRED